MAKQDDYVRYTIRVPEGLYRRIQAAAGEKSLNAEIVAALEEAYPAPRSLDFSRLKLHYFQWYLDDWHPIDEDSWARFRDGDPPAHIASKMEGNNNYFVVTVFDEGFLQNIISHNYFLDDGKVVWDGFKYLTKDEMQEYSRLMVAPTATPEDEKRVRDLRHKMDPAFALPPEAVSKLRDMLKGLAPEDDLERILIRVS